MSIRRRFDNLINFATGFGVRGYDSTVGTRPATGQAWQRRLSYAEIESLYLDDDLSRRIVEELPEDATRKPWKACDKATNAIIEEPEGLDIRACIREAAIDSRLFGAAGVVILFSGSAPEQPWTPNDTQPVAFLNVDRTQMSVTSYYDREEDLTNPKYTLPREYSTTPLRSGSEASGFMVSDTKILILQGDRVSRRFKEANGSFNQSVIQTVYSSLKKFLTVEGAIAQIVDTFETAEMRIDGLSDVLQSEDGVNLLEQRAAVLNESLSNWRLAVVDATTESYRRQFATIAGLDVVWDRFAHTIAKAAKMPMTQLFGMSPSGLSSDDESGRANWRKQVASYQNDVLRPVLEQYYRMLNGGRDVVITFSPLDESTASEEATIDKTRAETSAIYVTTGILAPIEVREQLFERGVISEAELHDDLEIDLEAGMRDAMGEGDDDVEVAPADDDVDEDQP